MNVPSFRDIFNFTPPAPVAPAATPPATPPLQPTDGNPPIPPTGTGDPIPDTSGNSSVVDFAKLWDTAPIDPENPPKPPAGYLPEIPVDQLQKAFSGMDFTKNISPEILAGINAGGEQAQQALLQALNHLARNVAMANYQATHKMVGAGLDKAVNTVNESLPTRVNAAISMNNLSEGNALMANPAYQPLVATVGQAILANNPKFNAAQVRAETTRYFDNLAKDAAAASKGQPSNQQTPTPTRRTDTAPDFSWANWEDNK